MSIELNKKLLESTTREIIDYNEIESLLNQGADPLGCYDEEYEDYVLEEIIMSSYERIYFGERDSKDRIVDIIEFLIDKGLDVKRIGKGEMWNLYFICSETAIQLLKIFIDNGISASTLEDFISHFYLDTEMVDGYYENEDKFPQANNYKKALTYGLKMIMFCASYPHILNNSEYLRSCLEIDGTNKENHYDLTKFRNYNNFDYEIDISTCDFLPNGLRNATIRIKDKDINAIVWVLHI